MSNAKKRVVMSALLIFTCAFACAMAGWAEEGSSPFSVEYPSTLVPGSYLPIRISAESGENEHGAYWAEMRDEDGKIILDGRSFSFGEDRPNAVSGSYVILGIPNTLDPGKYELRIYGSRERGEESEREHLFTEGVMVDERSFEKDVIPLRKSLTTLRRSLDPKRAEEAREIRRLYDTFEKTSLYDFEKLQVPVEYKYVTSRFGDRRVYEYDDGATARSIHTGIDFAAPTGTPVVAAGRGKVRLAKHRIISGYSVVIEHLPGIFSVYFHLDSLSVDPGEVVEKGEQIGTVGMTGLATGPHLHWEIRVQGVAVEPWALTKRTIFESILTTEEPIEGPVESEGG